MGIRLDHHHAEAIIQWHSRERVPVRRSSAAERPEGAEVVQQIGDPESLQESLFPILAVAVARKRRNSGQNLFAPL